MNIANAYVDLYHLSAAFEKLEDKDYENYMALITEISYYQEKAGLMEIGTDFFLQ